MNCLPFKDYVALTLVIFQCYLFVQLFEIQRQCFQPHDVSEMEMVRAGKTYTGISNMFAQYLQCSVGIQYCTSIRLPCGLSWYCLCYALKMMDLASKEDFRIYLCAFRLSGKMILGKIRSVSFSWEKNRETASLIYSSNRFQSKDLGQVCGISNFVVMLPFPFNIILYSISTDSLKSTTENKLPNDFFCPFPLSLSTLYFKSASILFVYLNFRCRIIIGIYLVCYRIEAYYFLTCLGLEIMFLFSKRII